MRLCVLRAHARGVSAVVLVVVCVGAPLRARVTHEMDGRAVSGAPPRVARVVYTL